MNCQPGDIAIVVKECRWKGRLLEVLYARPFGNYTLPDGQPARVDSLEPGWVVRMLEPIPARLTKTRMAIYGDATDSYLKPLRGLPDDVVVDESVTV